MTRIDIRPATEEDKDGIWQVLSTSVEYGNVCVYSYDMAFEDIMGDWLKPSHTVFVAESTEFGIVGTFYIKPFEIGLSSHVATGDFMAIAENESRGAMRMMVQSAVEQAGRRGFASFYVRTLQQNRRALRAFHQAGFHVTGSIPRAYRSPHGRFSAFVTLIRTLHRQ
jgi:L-amino acid N-acyltransferase YncA